MRQLLLFSNAPLAKSKDPLTSYKAAEKAVKTGLTKTHRRQILETLQSGPKTGKEIAGKAGIDQVAVMRRMHELVKAGKVRSVGTRDNQQIWESTNETK